MLFVIPLVAFTYHRSGAEAGSGRVQLKQAVPFFVFGFIALTGLRTFGDLGQRPLGLLTPDQWEAFLSTAGRLSSR